MSDENGVTDDLSLAITWFLAARAMVAARSDETHVTDEAAAGLYAEAILGISEQACINAKSADNIGVATLVTCLSQVGRLPRDIAEKVVTGVMMIAYTDAHMHPLEVRWASMLASAAELSQDDFQRCCASARVIASMLRPQIDEQSAEAAP